MSTEILTVVYCTDQSTYPFSVTTSGNRGVTVKDSAGKYWRYYPALESSSPTTAKVALSGTPSSKTWTTINKVDYVTNADKSSYVDTGVYVNQSTRIQGVLSVTRVGSSQSNRIFGIWVDTLGLYSYQGSNYYGATFYYGSSYTNTYNSHQYTKREMDINGNSWSIDGGISTWTAKEQTFSLTNTLFIFAANFLSYDGRIIYSDASMTKVHSFSICADGTTLSRNYVPIHDGNIFTFLDTANMQILSTTAASGTNQKIVGTLTGTLDGAEPLTYTHTIPTAISVYNGSAWVSAKSIHVYNGSGWVTAKSVSVHNGSEWK